MLLSKMSKKKVIAISGNIGSGKTTVAKIIKTKYPCIDVDDIVRILYQDLSIVKKINKLLFNQDSHILCKDKMKEIFSNEDKRRKMEKFLYPKVLQYLKNWIIKQSSDIVFVEMALVFEVNWNSYFDEIWWVTSSHATKRLQQFRNLDLQDIKKRQLLQKDYSKQSTLVIENNQDLQQLEKEVLNILWKKFKSK